ncbi:SH3 domain-containing protein [Tepidicaulis sp. LMO-SS28]|uniref:SH3 domain-containing protein n=1 Tax=Tepidicaulis sp. LMO-SS28 TaxID=3447455 RepID=UPI003EE15EF0
MRIASSPLAGLFSLPGLLAAGLFATVLVAAPALSAAAEKQITGPVTGLPLPRFVSLEPDTVNVRRGPSREHQVEWVYKRRGMPVEIIAEFDRWRRIRDVSGDTGWVYHSLLAGERTVLITGREEIALYEEPQGGSVVALAEPGVVAYLETCQRDQCQITVKGYTGWAARPALWGVYPGEMGN